MRQEPTSELTRQVLERLQSCADPRLQEVMTAVVRHLHALVEEIRLTDAEWLAAIAFLTSVGQTSTPQRQEFILLSDVLGVSSRVIELNHPAAGGSLDSAVLGPFHLPDMPERPLGDDFTDGMLGEPAFYSGRVLDTAGKPIGDAILDIWSSDGVGYYDVQKPGPLRPQGRGRLRTDARGRYWFRSVRPADYPVPTDGPVGHLLRALARTPFRPGHLHLIVSATGFETVVSQIFDGESRYLESDAVFGVRPGLIGRYRAHAPGPAPFGPPLTVPFHTVEFDLVLQPAA